MAKERSTFFAKVKQKSRNVTLGALKGRGRHSGSKGGGACFQAPRTERSDGVTGLE